MNHRGTETQIKLLFLLYLCLRASVAYAADLQTSWNSLVEAERTFARTSLAKGTKEAFLSALAEDAVIFRPRAVPARKWMQDNPAPASQLSWEPEFADIAVAGDLGYTTGPWEVRKTAQDPPAAFGHYVTMWRKQPDGQWKAELDNGIGHDRAAKPAKVESPELPKELGKPVVKTDLEKTKEALRTADKQAPSSLQTYFATDVRLYRDGVFPLVGKAAAEKRLRDFPGTLTSSQIDVKLSSSADLGYAYGTAEFKPEDKSKEVEYSNYLRIWKKQLDGSWKIVLDLLSPAPKP
jgi:ketosteroid isomerase-like protein